MPDTPDGTTSSNFSGGDVSLPNDQLLSATQPSAQQASSPASVPSPTSAPPAPGPQAGNAPPQPAPGQQQPSQAVVPGATSPSKPPTPGQPTGAPPTPQADPAVQKASRFYDVAEALAGGPRYKYNVDEYGNMQKTQVPVSGAHLGLAIAMEALSGMAAGAGVKPGPGVEGRAAAAGFQAGRQQAQAPNAQSQQQAQQDYARRAQVLETNLRMRNNALQVGRQSYDQNEAYVKQYADQAAQIQKEHPDQIETVAAYSDFAKYNFTLHNAIPYSVVPRLNNGQQAKGPDGEPLWDINYLILKPDFNMTGGITPASMKSLKEMGEPYADNPLLQDAPLRYSMIANLNAKAGNYELGKQAVLDGQKLLAPTTNADSGTAAGPISAATTGEGDKITFKNPEIAPAVAASTKKYNVPPSMVNAAIQHESAGDSKAKSPTSTASGLMQLIDSTAKSNGVTDPFNIQQNVDGGTKYLADLLDKTKHPNINGDPRLAFAAYAAGPGAVDSKGNIVDTKDQKADVTTKYANELFKLAGLANNQAAQATQAGGTAQPAATKEIDWADENKQDPTLHPALIKFQTALANSKNNSYADALNHMVNNNQADSANKIVNKFFGGDMANATKIDQTKALNYKTQEENTANDAKLSYDEDKKNATNKDIISRNDNLISSLAGGRNIDLSRIATMRAFDREIITNEVLRRNPDYNPGSIDRAIKLADEASDESKSGSIGNSIRNVNTAFGHMGEAADALNNLNKLQPREFSDYANKPMSWMNEHFGGNDSASQQYQAWKVSLNAAATDWQNLLNNQHALTDHDKEVAQMVANPNATFGNAMASLREMARTGAIRTLPLNQRWVETMHTPYPNLIEPQTIEALQKINDPATNNLLKDLQSGGDLVNGARGIGSPGKRVGDLLGTNNQQNNQQQTQNQPAPVAFKPVPGNANQYAKVSASGKIGKGPDGRDYIIATGLPR